MSRSRFVGCMVGSGIGDALGASFEGSCSVIRIEDVRFKGKWTDDTHMMIGLSESLIANKGFNGENMSQTFLRNWEKEPWRGYGPGPPRVFRMMKSGVPWNVASKQLYGGKGSFGNGAAMRVAPIGLLHYDDAEKLREMAYRSAEITHTHELGKEGAAIQAYAVALAVQEKISSLEPTEFLDRITHFTENKVYKGKLEKAKALLPVEDRREVIRNIGNSAEAFNSVPTAIYCFAKNHENYARAVLYAVSLGGDTDTIGAMTGAIAGAYRGEEDIPKSWRDKIEKGDYITDLAKKLWNLKDSSCVCSDMQCEVR